MSSRCVVTFAAALTFAFAIPVWAGQADHLKCFKVKDAQAKAKYTADLDGLANETGCSIKVPAKVACVATSETNTQPAAPGIGGTGTPHAFACYKATCPKGVTLPAFEMDDAFGSRMMTPVKSKLLCAPAVRPPTSCIEPFEPLLDVALEIFTSEIDASGDLSVAPACGATPDLCCPGGTPTVPCGPIHIDLTGASVAEPPGTDSLDLTYHMLAKTVSGLPTTVLGADCFINIDSSQGTVPTLQLDVPVTLTADHLHVLGVGTATITNLETADVTLTGGLTCSAANLGLSFFLGTVQSTLQNALVPATGLCRFCDSTIAPCGS